MTDDELGMIWWNRLTKWERTTWSEIAGNTGRAKDAWEAFKLVHKSCKPIDWDGEPDALTNGDCG